MAKHKVYDLGEVCDEFKFSFSRSISSVFEIDGLSAV